MLAQLVTGSIASCLSRAVDSFAAGSVAGQCRLVEKNYAPWDERNKAADQRTMVPADTLLIMHGLYGRLPEPAPLVHFDVFENPSALFPKPGIFGFPEPKTIDPQEREEARAQGFMLYPHYYGPEDRWTRRRESGSAVAVPVMPRAVFFGELLDPLPKLPEARIAGSGRSSVPEDATGKFAVIYHNRWYDDHAAEPKPESFYCNGLGFCEASGMGMDLYSLDPALVGRAAKFVLRNGAIAGAALSALVYGLYGMGTGEGADTDTLFSAAVAGGAGAMVSRKSIHPLVGILGASAVNAGIQWLFNL